MMVIFGPTGDLSKRKLIPALYRLYKRGIIGRDFPVVCIGRRNMDNASFLGFLDIGEHIKDVDKKSLKGFAGLISYHRIDFSRTDLPGLASFINETAKRHGSKGNRLFYLATPSFLFRRIIDIIRDAGLLRGRGWKRVVFEKPFGHDLASATELNRCISLIFSEDQIYRIDHYLGKELVQNILVFRFANTIFHDIWNSGFVDHVQITMAETIGIESRGPYYDKAGAIRDMMQNHMMQVLALTCMEHPATISAGDIRHEKLGVLKALVDPEYGDVVTGQYSKGKINSKEVAGYRDEPDVSHDSKTETYAALRVLIDNKRWAGVPLYLRTGKRLGRSYAEVRVCLKDVSCHLFCMKNRMPHPNTITFKIQPDEGVSISINVKTPGPGINIKPVSLDFCHECEFGTNSPGAYDMLIHQVITGDQTLFTSIDELKASWSFIERVQKIAAKKKRPILKYKAGTMGPAEAKKMLNNDGRAWIDI